MSTHYKNLNKEGLGSNHRSRSKVRTQRMKATTKEERETLEKVGALINADIEKGMPPLEAIWKWSSKAYLASLARDARKAGCDIKDLDPNIFPSGRGK